MVKQQRYPEAEAEYKRLLHRYPENGISWTNYGSFLNKRGAEALKASGNAGGRLEEALKAYRKGAALGDPLGAEKARRIEAMLAQLP